MNMISIKCFNCKQKRRLSKFCPDGCQVDLEETAAKTTELGDEQDPTSDEVMMPDPCNWLPIGSKEDGNAANARAPT